MFNQCTLRPAKGRRFLANAVSVLQWLDMAGRDFAGTVSVLHRLVKAQLASNAVSVLHSLGKCSSGLVKLQQTYLAPYKRCWMFCICSKG